MMAVRPCAVVAAALLLSLWSAASAAAALRPASPANSTDPASQLSNGLAQLRAVVTAAGRPTASTATSRRAARFHAKNVAAARWVPGEGPVEGAIEPPPAAAAAAAAAALGASARAVAIDGEDQPGGRAPLHRRQVAESGKSAGDEGAPHQQPHLQQLPHQQQQQQQQQQHGGLGGQGVEKDDESLPGRMAAADVQGREGADPPGQSEPGGRPAAAPLPLVSNGVALNDVLAEALAASRAKPIKVERDRFMMVELKPKVADLRIMLAKRVAAATSIAERRQVVHDELQAISAQSRAALVRLLEERNVQYTPLWITNSVFITTNSGQLLKEIEALDDVARVRPEVAYPLVPFMVDDVSDAGASDLASNWHLEGANVANAWVHTRGSGVVVGILDGGARFSHAAIEHSYRGHRTAPDAAAHDYNWLDVVQDVPEPRDVLGGLGTQMLSVALGGVDAGTGVAPAAKWFAANTCDYQYTCLERHVIVGIQFMLCPTRRDRTAANCTLGADVVLTGWGGLAGDATVRHVFNLFNMTGMIPVAPAGNQGPTCGTVLTPASYTATLGVGAVNRKRELATFSGRGPGQGAWGRLSLSQFPLEKPNWVAPGESVRAAHVDSDDAYMFFSGTHLSAAITAGVAALVLSVSPGLNFQQVHDVIRASLDPPPPVLGAGLAPCNATVVGRPDPSFSSLYGYGFINAGAAVDTAIRWRDELAAKIARLAERRNAQARGNAALSSKAPVAPATHEPTPEGNSKPVSEHAAPRLAAGYGDESSNGPGQPDP